MDDLELIKQKIGIVDLVSEYLPLKKTGANFKAPCPFHQEKTPSFVVSPERGIWHCFGCDRGGDIFKFIMEKESLTFPESLEFLADKAGITLTKTRTKDKSTDRLFEINQKAAQFYNYILTDHTRGRKALNYLLKRGLTKETIKEFQIGFAPEEWETLAKFLRKRGFTDQELIDSGLAVPSRKGCYDRFRGRVIFPLLDVRSRVIGFSGRVLDNSLPKYINTPQTVIFDKGKFLFGLQLTKGSIREAKEAILVEGEMDMLMSYQSGVKNIVATKGTALTHDQLDLLKKYTETLNLCFDTDLAGDSAARRGIELADQAGFNIKIIQLTSGKDPGEVALKDQGAWKQAVSEAEPIYDYYLYSTNKRFDTKTSYGKRAIFTELKPIWQKIHDPIMRDHYTEKLAAMLQVKESVIQEELTKTTPITNPLKAATMPAALPKAKVLVIKDRRRLLEEYLIALLLHVPTSYSYVPNFPETLFTQETLRQIYMMLVFFLDSIAFKVTSFKISEFVNFLPEELVEEVDKLYLLQIEEKLLESKAWQKELDLVTAELKKMLVKSSLEKLSLEIKNAQTFDKIETLEILNKRFRDLSVKLKNL